jgi:hypothetical protein
VTQIGVEGLCRAAVVATLSESGGFDCLHADTRLVSGAWPMTDVGIIVVPRALQGAVHAVIPWMSSLPTSSGSLNTSIATARPLTTVNASTANGRSPSNATTPAEPLTSAART